MPDLLPPSTKGLNRFDRLPSCRELGITYTQRAALVTVRKLEAELIDEMSYFTISQCEEKLNRIEGLIARHFPEDWECIQHALDDRVVMMGSTTPAARQQDERSESEVDQMFRELAAS